MNKFKVFFTFFAFLWLWLCGIGAIAQSFHARELAWLGVLLNAWALPLWMLVRFLFPRKYAGDSRESPAFFAVLMGLAIALLADAEQGWPVYLSIYNVLVILLYLHHLSAVSHPLMPRIDEEFPDLLIEEPDIPAHRAQWSAAAFCEKYAHTGVAVIFLRGPFCADSRRYLAELDSLRGEFELREIAVAVFSVRGAHWGAGIESESDFLRPFILAGDAAENRQFMAVGSAPIWARAWQRDAVRPSFWLLDNEGQVVWRALPENYRALPPAATIRDQLYRLED